MLGLIPYELLALSTSSQVPCELLALVHVQEEADSRGLSQSVSIKVVPDVFVPASLVFLDYRPDLIGVTSVTDQDINFHYI